MGTMRELLTQWAALEPERCRPFYGRWKVYLEEEWVTIDPGETGGKNRIGLPWIQWAIQEAIVGRGWYFNLGFHPLRASYRAEVGGKREWSEGGGSVEAFLSAYIKALEVQAGQG